MFGLGGKLAPADRTARAVAGAGLVIAGALLGVLAAPSAWVTVLVISVGVILVVEAALNYCPAAKVWPWNRPRSTPAPPGS